VLTAAEAAFLRSERRIEGVTRVGAALTLALISSDATKIKLFTAPHKVQLIHYKSCDGPTENLYSPYNGRKTSHSLTLSHQVEITLNILNVNRTAGF